DPSMSRLPADATAGRRVERRRGRATPEHDRVAVVHAVEAGLTGLDREPERGGACGDGRLAEAEVRRGDRAEAGGLDEESLQDAADAAHALAERRARRDLVVALEHDARRARTL